MKAKKFPLSFLFVLICLILSCSGREELKYISGKWILNSVYDVAGDEIIPIHEDDHLLLNRDRSFYFYMGYEDLEETGSWDLIRNQLIFTFHMLPGEDRYRKQYFDIYEQDDNLLIIESEGNYYRYERKKQR